MRNINSTVLYRWFQEVWNKSNVDAIDELMGEDTIARGITDENSPRGPEGFKAFFHDFKSRFSNVNVTVEDVVSEDDIETARCNVTATQTATGQNVRFSGLCMAKIKDGKIAEAWNHFDFLAMYQQLGHSLVANAS